MRGVARGGCKWWPVGMPRYCSPVRSGPVAVPCHMKGKCRCDVRWGQNGPTACIVIATVTNDGAACTSESSRKVCCREEQHWLEL